MYETKEHIWNEMKCSVKSRILEFLVRMEKVKPMSEQVPGFFLRRCGSVALTLLLPSSPGRWTVGAEYVSQRRFHEQDGRLVVLAPLVEGLQRGPVIVRGVHWIELAYWNIDKSCFSVTLVDIQAKSL